MSKISKSVKTEFFTDVGLLLGPDLQEFQLNCWETKAVI